MPTDFEQLVHQHGGRIRRIALRYAASGAVDDLVQDILVRLWRSYLDGLTTDEMDGVLGIGGDAISVRIHRLKQKFSATYVD